MLINFKIFRKEKRNEFSQYWSLFVIFQTINDVISGVVFYALHLYMISCGHDTSTSKVTALVLLNTRNVESYQTLEELTKPKAKNPWGNNFGFLHATMPKCDKAKEADPLYFVTCAKKTIKSKRNSLSVFLTGRFLEMMRKIRGPEVIKLNISLYLKYKRTIKHRRINLKISVIVNFLPPFPGNCQVYTCYLEEHKHDYLKLDRTKGTNVNCRSSC